MLVLLLVYIDAIEVLEVSVTCVLQLIGHVRTSLESSKTTPRVQPLTVYVQIQIQVLYIITMY